MEPGASIVVNGMCPADHVNQVGYKIAKETQHWSK